MQSILFFLQLLPLLLLLLLPHPTQSRHQLLISKPANDTTNTTRVSGEEVDWTVFYLDNIQPVIEQVYQEAKCYVCEPPDKCADFEVDLTLAHQQINCDAELLIGTGCIGSNQPPDADCENPKVTKEEFKEEVLKNGTVKLLYYKPLCTMYTDTKGVVTRRGCSTHLISLNDSSTRSSIGKKWKMEGQPRTSCLELKQSEAKNTSCFCDPVKEGKFCNSGSALKSSKMIVSIGIFIGFGFFVFFAGL